MGRKSIIPEIEKRYGKPIQEIIPELASRGGVKSIQETLGIKKSLAYELLDNAGIKSKPSDINQARLNFEGEMNSLIEQFLITKEIEGKTPITIKVYRGNLARFLWWLNDQGIPLQLRSAFTSDVLRSFLHYVKTSPVRFGGLTGSSRHLASQASVRAYWITFKSLGRWLEREGRIAEEESPMKKILRPRESKVIIPDIPEQVIKELLDKCNGGFSGLRNKAIILVLLDTGIRLNELANIKLSDLNLKDGLIKVFGKGQKERLVRLSRITREAVNAYLAIRGNTSPFLWLQENGRQLCYWGIQSFFRKWNREYPDVKITPHVFRHTFAMNYLRGDAETRGDPFTLQMLGGWADLNMPRRYTAALTQEDAFDVHIKASPVEKLFNGGNHKGDGKNEQGKSNKISKRR